ncbi:btk-binding protein-related [Anaeramoeba flamelloides]|uniref:Btk-binding protein-related n=1 Tax=Anaeramoeba flamelloides TaxID=1746091 RepID=A0AAV8A1H1_9EUKA|nr:btk-binding protein-related [Anaeramoeba flamelloides]
MIQLKKTPRMEKKSIQNPFKTKPSFQFNFFVELFQDSDDLNYNIPFFLIMEAAKNIYLKTEPIKVLSNDLLNFFNDQKSGDFLISDFKVHSTWIRSRFSKITDNQKKQDLDQIKSKLELLEDAQIKLFLQWLYCGNIEIIVEHEQEQEQEQERERERGKEREKGKGKVEEEEKENNDDEVVDYDGYIRIIKKKEKKIKKIEKILEGIIKSLGTKHACKDIEANWIENLKQLEKDSKSKDFSIKIPNQLNKNQTETIPIHRFILEARSVLYRELFAFTENEKLKGIQDYSKKSFRFWNLFVHYLYTSEIRSFVSDDDDDNENEKLQTDDLIQELEDVGAYFQISKPSLFRRLIDQKTNKDLKMIWIKPEKEDDED